MRVVISQSMYFPWVGLLEQVRLADVYVYYDDVQYVRGFLNRVQVKTEQGVRWLTVPLRDQHRGQNIDEVLVDNRADWRAQHRDVLRLAYRKAPFVQEMLAVVDEVFAQPHVTLADVSRASIVALTNYFALADTSRFLDSATMNVPGRSSQRLHDLVVHLGGTQYITGHGARNYLDHELFERSNIAVEYMQYDKVPYPQQHGPFTPFVTGLDLIANCGRDGARVIASGSVGWKQFVAQAA